jgi:hypothetical protein
MIQFLLVIYFDVKQKKDPLLKGILMPDAVPHLGVLDGYYDPFRIVQDMPIRPRSGREANVTGLGFDSLSVGIGLEVTRVVLRAILLVTDFITVGIVRFSFHVTPRIIGSPNAATPSKSYSA